jgi:hypothetical protein
MPRYDNDYGRGRHREMPEPGRGAYRGVGNWGGGRHSRYAGTRGGYDTDFEGIGNRSLDYGRDYRGAYGGEFHRGHGGDSPARRATGRARAGAGDDREAFYGGEYQRGQYGREFRKSRWQTDYGDPFHDREQHTPIRVLRGSFEDYADEFRTGGSRRRSGGYGADYRERHQDWRY